MRIQVLLVDGQSSPAALTNTMDEYSCSTWVVASEVVDILGSLIKEKHDVVTIEIPSLGHWLAEGEFSVYPYAKPWEEAKFDPAFGIYTSGSTGTCNCPRR